MDKTNFHIPAAWERAVMDRLLEEMFVGHAEIHSQLASCLVCNNSKFDGGFELLVTDRVFAPVNTRVPVSIAAYDSDKRPIIADLHVVNGIAYMVQVLKADGTSIIKFPTVWVPLLVVCKINH